MPSFEVDDSQLTAFAKKMARFLPALQHAIDANDPEQAETLRHLIQVKASGRPGPEIVTGAYRNSFLVARGTNGYRVYTAAPQAHRLEYGFIGTDSLGRVYAQGPFPHIRPATEEFRPIYRRSIAQIPRRVWREL